MSHKIPAPQTLYIREEAVHRSLAKRFRCGRPLNSPDLVRTYLQAQLAELEHEVFCMMALDSRHRLIAQLELFRGTIDWSSVHPREVARRR